MATQMRVVSEADFQAIEDARPSLKRKRGPETDPSLKPTTIETPANESPFKEPFLDRRGTKKAQITSVMEKMTKVSGDERYYNAWAILNTLLSPSFEWNEEGNITFLGNAVPGSNIVDLISAVVNTDENLFKYVGGPTFALAILKSKRHLSRIIKPKLKRFFCKYIPSFL